MITVTYKLTKKNFVGLDVKGHAESGDYGKDLICAGVSTVVFGLMNALDELGNAEIKEKDNHITIKIVEPNDISNNYMNLALTQLKTIEESYKKFIKVERK